MSKAILALALLVPAAFAQEKEEGFVPLFNGKDFTGWKFFLGKADADPGKVYSVVDGTVVCVGKPAGYMYTENKYKDCTLRFDYRFKRPDEATLTDAQKKKWLNAEGKLDDDKWDGNSGYLLFVNDHKVWPYSLECQGMNKQAGTIFFIGGKDKEKNKFKWDKAAYKKGVKPLGEWNAYEIVVKEGMVEVNLNGEKVTTVSSHEYTEPGYIGFQSEGAEIHWRNIRIKAK